MPRDTTSEFAALHRAWWLGLDGSARARWWMQRIGSMNQLRFAAIKARNPGASDGELMALWTEESYRGTMDPDFLARACAAIRAYHDGR